MSDWGWRKFEGERPSDFLIKSLWLPSKCQPKSNAMTRQVWQAKWSGFIGRLALPKTMELPFRLTQGGGVGGDAKYGLTINKCTKCIEIFFSRQSKEYK